MDLCLFANYYIINTTETVVEFTRILNHVVKHTLVSFIKILFAFIGNLSPLDDLFSRAH